MNGSQTTGEPPFSNQIKLPRWLQLEDDGTNRIDSISDDNIRLNMNHPLAGKELHFDITIAGVREATSEEVSHGHVHADQHH